MSTHHGSSRSAFRQHQSKLGEAHQPGRALVRRTHQQAAAARRAPLRSVNSTPTSAPGSRTWNRRPRPFVWTKTAEQILRIDRPLAANESTNQDTSDSLHTFRAAGGRRAAGVRANAQVARAHPNRPRPRAMPWESGHNGARHQRTSDVRALCFRDMPCRASGGVEWAGVHPESGSVSARLPATRGLLELGEPLSTRRPSLSLEVARRRASRSPRPRHRGRSQAA